MSSPARAVFGGGRWKISVEFADRTFGAKTQHRGGVDRLGQRSLPSPPSKTQKAE
jgi:hypothetical protein